MMKLTKIISILFALALTQNAVFAKDVVMKKRIKSYPLESYTLLPNATEFELSGNSFITTGHFNENGKRVPLPSGTGFSSTNGQAFVRYGFTRNLEGAATFRYRYNASVIGDNSTTSSGPESVSGRVRYGLDPVAGWKYSFDFHAGQTLYDNASFVNSTDTKSIALGDSGSEFGLTANLTKDLSSFYTFALSAGYVLPAGELSHEIRYKWSNILFTTNWSLTIGVDGVWAVGNDPYSGDPENRKKLMQGETYLYNSLNRQYAMPFAQVGYALTNNFRLNLGGGKVVLGRSTDEGMKVFGGLTWNSGTGRNDDEVKINEFKEYETEASVIELSEKSNFVKIDQGLSGNFYTGMQVDVFDTDFFGGNILLATGQVVKASATWSIVKILKSYGNKAIKTGHTVRGR